MFENQSNLNKEPEDIFASAQSTEPTTSRFDKGGSLPKTVNRQISGHSGPKILKIILIIIVIALVSYGGYYTYGKVAPSIKAKLAQLKSSKNLTPTTNEVVNNEVNNTTSGPSIILDSDKDGLSDQEEQSLGTDPNKADSDNDGLLDNEEVNIYKSNPLNSDTNNDGILDGDSIRRGINPINGAPLFDLQKAINNL
jgi:hypothetical protein